MITEWKEYSGSDEQIAELGAACTNDGFIIRDANGICASVIKGENALPDAFLNYIPEMSCSTTHYLICEPHPFADMICQQARTGQPV